MLTALQACRGGTPELEAAYLVRLADSAWLDIAAWAGQPGVDVFDDPAQAASRSAFYGQIDELLGEECGTLVYPGPAPPPSVPVPPHGPGRAAP